MKGFLGKKLAEHHVYLFGVHVPCHGLHRMLLFGKVDSTPKKSERWNPLDKKEGCCSEILQVNQPGVAICWASTALRCSLSKPLLVKKMSVERTALASKMLGAPAAMAG